MAKKGEIMNLIKKIALVCIIAPLYLQGLSPWQFPTSDRRYDHIAFLCSHNSFSNQADGYIQPQQKWSIQEQLDNGIRAFMLDTYYSCNIFGKNCNVNLCHNSCTLTETVLRPFKGNAPRLVTALKTIADFLDKNPKEIITIFLENYVDKVYIDQSIQELPEFKKYVLTPWDWNPDVRKGWPLLSWMQQKNKRVVIFNSKEGTFFTYFEWAFHAENVYSEVNLKDICMQRKTSREETGKKQRYLYVMNFFPEFYVKGTEKKIQGYDFNKINNETLRTALNQCLDSGLDQEGLYKKRYPNFIALDFVNEGDAMAIINELNLMANDSAKRQTMFAPLDPVPDLPKTKAK